MSKQRSIELLSPAKNIECGIEAIYHGADAVYIGAPRFGARYSAGNSIEDIGRLVEYAHLFHVRICVALNTIIYEHELKDVEAMIWDLYRVGVDAIIIQDLGILQLHLPPIPLHASTQVDTRDIEKVRFLQDAGFTQIVLARELTLEEARAIHEAVPDVVLETFVHGALCVSYSGQCYVSQANTQRSANRGECSQFCRLSFDMVDANGEVISQNKHLLSLKDLNRSEHLEELMDAGLSSFKIEGRMKDVSYVKNVTAAYRKKIDEILERRTEYRRASSGRVRFTFTPQLNKTFTRGFTTFYLHGRQKDIGAFDSPKSKGEEMGEVKEIHKHYFTVSTQETFHNGDGLCFIDEEGKLQGFRLNKVEGNKLFPMEMPRLRPQTKIFRNFNITFDKLLGKKTAERRIDVKLTLSERADGFLLTATDEDNNAATISFTHPKELARTSQEENIRQQLGKLGATPFFATDIEIKLSDNWFIPSSILAERRRQLIEILLDERKKNYPREISEHRPTTHHFPLSTLDYRGNVANSLAEQFYKEHGVVKIDPAFELQEADKALLMSCKHCLRYTMGWCPTFQKEKSPYQEPYYLVSADKKRFRLSFDCKACIMHITAE